MKPLPRHHPSSSAPLEILRRVCATVGVTVCRLGEACSGNEIGSISVYYRKREEDGKHSASSRGHANGHYSFGDYSLKLEYHQDDVHIRGSFAFKQTKGKHRSERWPAIIHNTKKRTAVLSCGDRITST